MRVLQSQTFKREAKRLHAQQKAALDDAVRFVVSNPSAGESKVGDLAGVRVYKFRINNNLTLLAYELDEEQDALVLLALGSHENFYRDLKR